MGTVKDSDWPGDENWPAWRAARRQESEKLLGPEEWIETAQYQLGFQEDIFRPARIRFRLLRNRNGTVDRDLIALQELFAEIELRFNSAQASLEKARAKLALQT